MRHLYHVGKLAGPLLIGCSFLFYFSCNKTASSAALKTCLDFSVVDSVLPFGYGGGGGYNDNQQTYIFNADKKLVQHLGYGFTAGAPTLGSSDSFAYSNGNMVKSYFSLGNNNSQNTYTTSEYDYNGHAMVASRYYLGNLLMVHSSYSTDSLGRVTSVTQFADNMTYQWTPTYSYRISFDARGNVSAITTTRGDTIYAYTGYDNHPNPYYGLPLDWPYNAEGAWALLCSKNNYRYEWFYGNGTRTCDTFPYNYDASGRLSSYHFIQGGGPTTGDTKTFRYGCN